MTITLTREEAQQILDALQCATPPTFSAKIVEDWQSAVELLRARLAQPEQEPVAWMMLENKLVPIHTAPPQREWQGLTDEEMSEAYNMKYNIYKEHVEYVDFVLIYRAIEAKLKEKNT